MTQCKNGEEALAVLRDHPQSVDLILLDMQMPKKNGLQMIREVQEVLGPPASDIPIVAISGIKEPDLIKALAKRGIRNFLLKPVSKADLGTRMAAALGIELDKDGGSTKAPWL